MDVLFKEAVESLHPSFERLLAMLPVSNGAFPKAMPRSGVYLFSEGQTHLYVGRSNNLRARYNRHCRPGATHRQAAFAFHLAREETGLLKASYRAGAESRTGLIARPDFLAAFTAAKARIRKMHYRFVEENDQTRQALLEIYCAVTLKTPYNDFKTH